MPRRPARVERHGRPPASGRPVASNTTQDITAVDYRGPGDLYYATANGQIFKNGALQLSVPGVSFTGIELNPSGTAGLATANNGKLYRYNGTTWGARQPGELHVQPHLPRQRRTLPRTFTPTGNLTGVSWKDDTTAYVSSADRGVVLKTTNGGTTWIDVSRQSDGTCFADEGSSVLFTDVATVKGTDLVYVLGDSFGHRQFSADGFAGPASLRDNSSVNCFNVPVKIALDQDNPNRSFAVAKCGGSLSMEFSSDGAVTYEGLSYPIGSGNNISTLYDVAIAGGNAIAVGDGGVIVTSPDGLKGYFQPADGSEATTGWRAVDKFDANNAAVGGLGGKLVISTAAGTIPDLIPPGRHHQRAGQRDRRARRSRTPRTSPTTPAARASTPRRSSGPRTGCRRSRRTPPGSRSPAPASTR